MIFMYHAHKSTTHTMHIGHPPQVLDLQREQHRLQSGLANVEALKREVHHLGCELLAERSRVRAMSDELETPLNVHRCVGRCWWRGGTQSLLSLVSPPPFVSPFVFCHPLSSPRTLHRWRKLESSDPPLFEMVVKVQMLQKRLLAKTEEVADKEAQLAEREEQYAALKGVLARHPGPEVAEQLGEYRVGALFVQEALQTGC